MTADFYSEEQRMIRDSAREFARHELAPRAGAFDKEGWIADDAVANKVCALFGRALPRDFLDVDAAIMSGRYTREQLLELAAEADHGFDRLLFADALGALTQITDTAFAEYRTDSGTVTDMRHRFAEWRRELLAAGSR